VPVSMLGGSWAPVGGHNPHEALALGCHVLHGPNIWNFTESYDDLDAQNLSEQVITVQDLAQAISRAWLQTRPLPPDSVPKALEPLENLLRLAQTG
jgi:3-deoxy-D-manno-octulosonic-acid transferase